jgi:hypothetical protein
VKKILMYRKDILKAVSKTNIKTTVFGPLWIEAIASQNDLDTLSFHKIWYEVINQL